MRKKNEDTCSTIRRHIRRKLFDDDSKKQLDAYFQIIIFYTRKRVAEITSLFISSILFSPFFGSLCLSTVLNYDNNDDKFWCITFSISVNVTLSLSPFTSRLSDNLIEMKTHKSIQVLVNPRCPLSMTSLHFLW